MIAWDTNSNSNIAQRSVSIWKEVNIFNSPGSIPVVTVADFSKHSNYRKLKIGGRGNRGLSTFPIFCDVHLSWGFQKTQQVISGPWVLFWALKKALKRANSLKKTLLRANPLFWVLKKVFNKVSLIKRVLKKVLLWVINSKKCSKKSGLLKKVKFESSAQKRAHLSWTSQKNAQKSGLH